MRTSENAYSTHSVNKGPSLAASQFAPTANKRLYFVDERQQILK
jgi:hypothetical protein